MKTEIKLNQFFENELKSDLKEVLITKDKTGRYSLFGKYTVVPTKQGWFKVFSKDDPVEFETVRNAVAWCTLHHAGKLREAKRVQALDLQLSSIYIDLLVHRQLLRKHLGRDSKWLYVTKLQEDTRKRKQILDEITSYINSSKMIQTSKFNRTNQTKIRCL
jgi:hypothetical protein